MSLESLISTIFINELNHPVRSISEIKGMGSVNAVFDVDGEFIIRLNDLDKKIEYQKEAWCLDAVARLHIPVPYVLAHGTYGERVFIIQEKVPGINGKTYRADQRSAIYRMLGTYAKCFQSIKHIDNKAVEKEAFHKDWRGRLAYNLRELHEKDSLLEKEIFDPNEHRELRSILESLDNKNFQTGLVHGDLSLRNVLVNGETIYLLDWGTAEINVVPHTEIGILLMENEANHAEIEAFLEGMDISTKKFKELEGEILRLNLLKRLDIYRWAEGRNITHLNDYEGKLKKSFDKAMDVKL